MKRAPAPANSYTSTAPPPRAIADDEDEYDTPAAMPDAANLVGEGWAGADRIVSTMPSDFADFYTVPKDPKLVKFLSDGPFASYRQHWAEWLGQGVKLSYVCLGEDCPVCDVGDRASARICFNIIDFSDPKGPLNKVWVVGIKVSNILKKLNQGSQPRTGPLNAPDMYYSVYKSGGEGSGKKAAGTTQFNIAHVKGRDVFDDWGVNPLSEEQIGRYTAKAFSKDQTVSVSTREQLQAVADAYTGGAD